MNDGVKEKRQKRGRRIATFYREKFIVLMAWGENTGEMKMQ